MNTANMAAVMALAISAGSGPIGNLGGSPTPIGGLRPNGGKFGPFAIGARERSRLAWRQRVDAAAREMNRCREYCLGLVDGPDWDRVLEGGPEAERFDEATSAMDASRYALDAALAAPRPWRSPRKPEPRFRYSRSHRRACQRCKRVTYWVAEVKWARKCGRPEYRRFVTRELIHFRRDHHGRRER